MLASSTKSSLLFLVLATIHLVSCSWDRYGQREPFLGGERVDEHDNPITDYDEGGIYDLRTDQGQENWSHSLFDFNRDLYAHDDAMNQARLKRMAEMQAAQRAPPPMGDDGMTPPPPRPLPQEQRQGGTPRRVQGNQGGTSRPPPPQQGGSQGPPRSSQGRPMPQEVQGDRRVPRPGAQGQGQGQDVMRQRRRPPPPQ